MDPELRARYDLIHQGESAERIAEKWHLSREDVDSYAAESHRRASEAARAGRNREILPTPALNADGQPFTLNRDDGVREVIDRAKMAILPTVFRPAGNGVVPETVSLALAPQADPRAAEAATRALAHGHYENFSVVSVLLPRRLRKPHQSSRLGHSTSSSQISKHRSVMISWPKVRRCRHPRRLQLFQRLK